MSRWIKPGEDEADVLGAVSGICPFASGLADEGAELFAPLLIGLPLWSRRRVPRSLASRARQEERLETGRRFFRLRHGLGRLFRLQEQPARLSNPQFGREVRFRPL